VDCAKSSLVGALALLVTACGGRTQEPGNESAAAGARAGSAADAGVGSASGSDGASEGGGAGTAGSAGTSSGSGQAGADGARDAAVADASSDGAAAGDAAADAGPGSPANNDCLDGIANFAEEGPFAHEQRRSGSVQMWIPEAPPDCKVPIVHFANGTGATCAAYAAILEHLASHGFLATCYENPSTGAGTQCVTAIETALAEFPDLADAKVGSGGHGTGGGSALLCVAHAEAHWGDALQIVGHGSEPDLAGIAGGWADLYAQISSPIFIFNGSEDFLVSENGTRPHFDALAPALEAYWYEGSGATHVPVPVSWINESMVAWFRWKLLDDGAACEHFKAMPDSDDWDLQEVRNPSDC
jgi:hypothetical protein